MTLAPSGAAIASPPPFVFAPRPAPRWFGRLALVLLVLVAPIGYLGQEGEALVSAVGGAAALFFVLQRRLPSVGVLILAALVVWAVISFSWSPLAAHQAHPRTYKALEALTAPKLVLQLVVDCAFVSGVLKLSGADRLRALDALSTAFWATVVVTVLDTLLQGRLFGVLHALTSRSLPPDLMRRDAARAGYVLSLLFWPVALANWRRRPTGLLALVGGLIALTAVALGVAAPAFAMGLSAAVFLAVRLRPRLGLWACLAAVVAYFVLAPLLFLPHGTQPAADLLPSDIGKLSWHRRIEIWRFASGLVSQRPWIGHGLDASRAYDPLIPMHPHDAALQLWLELGAPGALFGALFFAWLVHRIDRARGDDAAWAASAAATVTVYVFIGAVSFGVWQEWWLSLGAVAAACSGLVLQQRRAALTEALEADEVQGGLRALSA